MVWSTTNDFLLPSLTTGQFLGANLLADVQGLTTTDQGMLILRTHLVITPNVAPALNDGVTVGVAVARNFDVTGANVTNGLTTAQNDYPWAFLRAYRNNGGLTPGGGSSIEIDIKSHRRIRYDQEAYGLFITSNFVAATQFRMFSRVLVALP